MVRRSNICRYGNPMDLADLVAFTESDKIIVLAET